MNLFYADLLIGIVEDAVYCDLSWNGVLVPDPALDTSAIGSRILKYKKFCESWNRRLAANPDRPPSPNEFHQYRDIAESDMWFLVNVEDGVRHHVNAPLFLRGGAFICRPWSVVHPDIQGS
jgi:hypothetical protein